MVRTNLSSFRLGLEKYCFTMITSIYRLGIDTMGNDKINNCMTHLGQGWSLVRGNVGSCDTSATIWVSSLQIKQIKVNNMATIFELMLAIHRGISITLNCHLCRSIFYIIMGDLMQCLLDFMSDVVHINTAVICRLRIITIPTL